MSTLSGISDPEELSFLPASLILIIAKTRKFIFRLRFLMILQIFTLNLYGQDTTVSKLKELVADKESDKITFNREKIYIHSDKDSYLENDTLWLKAYVLNSDLVSSQKSGVVYLELINNLTFATKRFRLPVANGIGWGNLVLDESEYKVGAYTLRAYTNWMRNFGEHTFFEKAITISTEMTAPAITAGKSNVFDKLSLESNRRLSPSKFKSNSAIDLQFLPEGGRMIAGIPSLVAFKAIGQDGRPATLKGQVLDARGEVVADFSTVHQGMGAIVIIPEAGAAYTAIYQVPGGGTAKTVLPKVSNSGTNLHIDQTQDSVQLSIQASPDLLGSYMLMAESRQSVRYAVKLNVGANGVRQSIAKALFPGGIVRFSVMDESGRPLNQRSVFVSRPEEISVTLKPHKEDFSVSDSISSLLKISDLSGQPVVGSFSIAVTSDKVAGSWQEHRANIWTEMMLNADVKGTIEDPGYYYAIQDPVVVKNLDLLLLTQAWVDYRYAEKPLRSMDLKFPAEADFVISGKVKNAFGKGVSGILVQLYGKKPPLIEQSKSDNFGRFTFKGLPISDSLSYQIQAGAKGGNKYSLEVDEFIAPTFAPRPAVLSTANLIDNDQELVVAVGKDSVAVNLAKPNLKGVNQLEEVKIAGKKIIKDSHNLNGPGKADIIFDEKELTSAGRKNLLDLMNERIKSFRSGMFPPVLRLGPQHLTYLVDFKEVRIIVDGYHLAQQYNPGDAQIYLTNYLKAINAEDVKGIEVMYSSKYNYAYNMAGLNLLAGATNMKLSSLMDNLIEKDYVYIEITTRTGNGAFVQQSSGNYLFKPITVLLAKDFYVPKYGVDQSNSQKRATVYWSPNIITNAKGEALISFPAVGFPGSYSYVLEGSNLEGNVAFTTGKFLVK